MHEWSQSGQGDNGGILGCGYLPQYLPVASDTQLLQTQAQDCPRRGARN